MAKPAKAQSQERLLCKEEIGAEQLETGKQWEQATGSIRDRLNCPAMPRKPQGDPGVYSLVLLSNIFPGIFLQSISPLCGERTMAE